MHRPSIEAAAALMASGNSRNTNRTVPVSIYFDFNIGKTFSSKAAQCGQLMEAYSTMLTAALADPSTMSGSDTGLTTSWAVALSAMAASIRAGGAAPATQMVGVIGVPVP